MPVHSRLARLQQVLVTAVAGMALAWGALHWGDSPLRAVAGAVVIALSHAWIMALQYVMVWRASRNDSVPPPAVGELVRAWWGEVRVFPQVFYWRQPFRWRCWPDRTDAASRGRRGVVLVHGFVCNRGFWAPWLQRLQAQQRAFVAVNLEPVFTSIDDYTPLIERAVAEVAGATGLAPVLVCHSMGGLAARAWLRSAGDASRVHRVITIGTPHGGTWLARFSHTPNGSQMRLDSEWLQALQRHEAASTRPAFTCWYSNCDNIVFPASTASLAGADNRLVLGPAHVELGFHPQVMDASLALVADP